MSTSLPCNALDERIERMHFKLADQHEWVKTLNNGAWMHWQTNAVSRPWLLCIVWLLVCPGTTWCCCALKWAGKVKYLLVDDVKSTPQLLLLGDNKTIKICIWRSAGWWRTNLNRNWIAKLHCQGVDSMLLLARDWDWSHDFNTFNTLRFASLMILSRMLILELISWPSQIVIVNWYTLVIS